MKAYRMELLVLDFENYGEEELKMLAMNARGLDPTVISIEGRDIGAWSDDHPLNKRSTADAEYRRLFAVATKDIEKLKARALAAKENDFENGSGLTGEFLAFMDEATPDAVLDLIAEVERLRDALEELVEEGRDNT